MAAPESLSDTSWTVHYIPSAKPLPTLYGLLSRPQSSASLRRIQDLSNDCREYLSSRGPAYRDELNDETERTGQLRECTIGYVKFFDTDTVLGLSIETHYQKTSYKIILVARQSLDASLCPVSTILYKASQSHIKSIKSWLDERFGLPWASPLQFPVQLLPRLCSQFLMGLDQAWTGTDGEDALRQGALRQIVGNLKITFTFSNASGVGIAPNLRNMDFDVPAETVGLFLNKAKERGTNDGHGFLDELAEAIHEKTGLKLPLTDKVSATVTDDSSLENTTGSLPPEQLESPLKITKIICAAFALRADGAIKLASKPTEDAEVIGYDGDVVRRRYMELLRIIFEEAERRQHNG